MSSAVYTHKAGSILSSFLLSFLLPCLTWNKMTQRLISKPKFWNIWCFNLLNKWQEGVGDYSRNQQNAWQESNIILGTQRDTRAKTDLFYSWHQERCSWKRSRAVVVFENSSLGVFTIAMRLHKLTFVFVSILHRVTLSEKSKRLVPKGNNKLEKTDV